MSRAALLPTPGDPFLVSYWLRNFRTWAQYVDQLYVYISWRQSPEVEARLRSDIEAAGGIVVGTSVGDTEHGKAMEILLASATEDVIFYTEDDLYIRNPAYLGELFCVIEQDHAEIVGVPRGSMAHELLKPGLLKYPGGPALWPNMLLARAERFRAITEGFSARVYAPGDVVLGIDYTVQGDGDVSADTFGAAAMEMQDGARLHRLPEHSVMTNRNGEYIHVGSLSSGPQPARSGNLEGQNGDSWAIRTQQWRRFHRTWPGGLEAEHENYGRDVDRLVQHFGTTRVDKWDGIFTSLLTWDETC